MRMIVFPSGNFYLLVRVTCSCCLNLCLQILEELEGKGGEARSDFVALILNKGVW